MRLTWLTLSLLLFEYALTSHYLVRHEEEIPVRGAALAGAMVLAFGIAVLLEHLRRPIPARRYCKHLLAIGLLNLPYGGLAYRSAQYEIDYLRSQRAHAMREWKSSELHPNYRIRYEDERRISRRLDEIEQEMSFQEERQDYCKGVLIFGTCLTIVAAGGLIVVMSQRQWNWDRERQRDRPSRPDRGGRSLPASSREQEGERS